ncbi:MAG TPA: integrase, partial [Pseudolabrys sp.]|nr:integrase [Pseudolabrys sp.]
WADAMAEAAISGLHFHDLRGTAVTMLAEAGCTVPEIAAITGHSLDHVGRILDKYLKRTAQLAEAAIFKLEAHAAKRKKRLQKN